MRNYYALNALNRGEVITIQEIKVMKVAGEIKAGDLYVAERNTGPHLLTAAYIHPKDWIRPVESAYSYDIWECVKVKMVE